MTTFFINILSTDCFPPSPLQKEMFVIVSTYMFIYFGIKISENRLQSMYYLWLLPVTNMGLFW